MRLRRFKITQLLVVYGLYLLGSTAQAQTTPQAQSNPRVNRVVESQIAINNPITIVVDDLDKWIQEPNHDYRKFVLHLDGNPLKGLQPALIDVKDDSGAVQKALRFDLARKSENREAWTAVFSRRRPGEFTNRNVLVSLQQDGAQILGQAEVNLKVIDWKWFWLFILFALGFLVGCAVLCIKTDMLRVPGPGPIGLDSTGKPSRKGYSLARTQMAFWFFVVVVSYLFIWMATGFLSNLPASVLSLIGISAATGLVAAAVDSSKKTDQENLVRTLKAKRQAGEMEVDRLLTEISGLQAAIATQPPPQDIDQKKNELVEKQGQLAAQQKENAQTDEEISKILKPLQPVSSNGFIKDVLSDDDGVSFHRLQIFGWTVVLIIIFVVSVYDVLAMPDFDTTLLALMGISGGTYLGFKLPNQQG